MATGDQTDPLHPLLIEIDRLGSSLDLSIPQPLLERDTKPACAQSSRPFYPLWSEGHARDRQKYS